MEKIYWTFFQEGQVRFLLAATARGLCFTGVLNKELGELAAWAQKKYKQAQLIECASRLQPYYDELSRFMRGECRDLACPIDVKGTPFQQ